jgi:hypothetical protein
MKSAISLLIVCVILITVVGTGCGFSIFKTGKDLLRGHLDTNHWRWSVFNWCTNGLPFVDRLSSILDNKNYIVLLQNNMELRSSGGFIGSYAVINTQKSGIVGIKIQDIYVPDGQIVGHVDPPLPVQQAFGQGWWKLRDSNWDIDFASASSQIAWFFEQGGESSDGIVAINLGLVRQILQIIGPVKPLDYPDLVTSDNFYSLAQTHAEENFFPGSTQKRDFLGAAGREVINRIKTIKPMQSVKLLKTIFENLENRNILVWLKDEQLQKEISFRGWSGELGDSPGNYLYIADTNLGANKANCCISRSVRQRISESDTQLEVTWKNDNPFTNPRPPEFWGGDYINWVRIVVPRETKIQSIYVGNHELKPGNLIWQYGLQEDIYEVEERDDFKIIGFWAKVPAQSSLTVSMNYELSALNTPVLVRRQPGVESFDYKLTINGETKFDSKIYLDTIIN